MARTGQTWTVYIVRCADGTLYTGVAVDVAVRLAQHNGLRANGARYTRARRPVKLVYHESAANRSAACRREYHIKRMTRPEKLVLIAAAGRVSAQRSVSRRKRASRATA